MINTNNIPLILSKNATKLINKPKLEENILLVKNDTEKIFKSFFYNLNTLIKTYSKQGLYRISDEYKWVFAIQDYMLFPLYDENYIKNHIREVLDKKGYQISSLIVYKINLYRQNEAGLNISITFEWSPNSPVSDLTSDSHGSDSHVSDSHGSEGDSQVKVNNDNQYNYFMMMYIIIGMGLGLCFYFGWNMDKIVDILGEFTIQLYVFPWKSMLHRLSLQVNTYINIFSIWSAIFCIYGICIFILYVCYICIYG